MAEYTSPRWAEGTWCRLEDRLTCICLGQATAPEDDWDDDDWEDDDDDQQEDSHVLGERRVHYVEPTWEPARGERDDAELSKCARCSRFFVEAVPIRFFQDLGDKIVLGLEICEECAPVVMTRVRR